MIHAMSILPLSSRHRVSQIHFHPTQPYLAVQSHDRSVDIFRIRSDEEVHKKQARRKKRVKEKEQAKGNAKNNENKNLDQPINDAEVQLVDKFTPHLVVRASSKIRSFDFGSNDVGPRGGLQVS